MFRLRPLRQKVIQSKTSYSGNAYLATQTTDLIVVMDVTGQYPASPNETGSNRIGL